jgi:hypothetical protein
MEVPLPIAGDQRAWDALMFGFPDDRKRLPIDADTRLIDGQAQVRRIMLKLRDSGFEAVMWVLADTHANRDAIAAGASLLQPDFPISPRRALSALAAGDYPGGSAIVLL